MTTALRLALRIATSRHRSQRWRQMSLVVAAGATTALLALCVAMVSLTEDVERTLANRMPVLTAGDEPPAAFVVPRGLMIGLDEGSIRWIEPAPGYEDDPVIVPPGLDRLPAPGEAVVSPGLRQRGATAAELGFTPSTAGAGADGTIGPDGVGTQDELVAWVRPVAGRTLDGGGRPVGISGFVPAATDGAADRIDSFSPGPPTPSPSDTRTLALLLVALPAVVAVALAARARSHVRTARAETFLRLGVRRPTVRGILALEGAALAGIGAALGALLVAVSSPVLTTLPLSGTRTLPGALTVTPAALLAVAGATVAVAATVSAAGRLVPSTRDRRHGRPSPWLLTPVTLGLLAVAAAGGLLTDGTQMYYVGVGLVAVGIPLATPVLAVLASRHPSARATPHGWLAAARVEHSPSHTSRVAALLALTVYLGATSVAMLLGPGAQGGEDRSSATGPAAYVVDWHDARPGDVDALRDRLAASHPDAVVLPAVVDPGTGTAVARVSDCSALRPVEQAMAVRACGVDDTVADEAGTVLTDLVGVTVEEGVPVEAADMAVVLSPTPLPSLDLTAAGSQLPAFNPHDAMASASVRSPLSGWIASCSLISMLVLGTAIVRELIEHARTVALETPVLVRTGLSEQEAASTARTTLLLPVTAAVPLAYVCGLVTSFSGAGPQITRYTPVWVTASTGVTVAITTGAVALSLALVRGGSDAGRTTTPS